MSFIILIQLVMVMKVLRLLRLLLLFPIQELNSDDIDNLPISDVWNHFKKIEDSKTMKIKSFKCDLCAKQYKSSCTTSTLQHHLIYIFINNLN